MGSFLSRHQYLVIWICGLAIVGAAAVLILQLNQSFLPMATPPNQSAATPPAASTGIAVPSPSPSAPIVSLTIQKTGKGNVLIIQWGGLPDDTAALNIFRGKGQSTSTWALWKTVQIGQGQLSGGSAQFTLGAGDAGYEYYVQAINGGGGGGGNSTSSDVLWTSPPTTPGTGEGAPPPTPTPANESSTGGNPANSTNTTSTGGQGGSQPPVEPSSTTPSSSSPGGNAYYNPKVQVTGYGTANGTFWAQHVNQSIGIGWQNLPPGTDDIILFRSQAENGPWSQLLEQKNPGSTGSYSLQLVDGTLNDPYYYELTAYQGTVSSATYGPVFLPPAGQ